MPGARILLYAALVLVNVAFIATWIATAKRRHLHERARPSDIAIGFGTSFLDTLGIGSNAQMTALFKLRGDPADELIPGRPNVSSTIPVFFSTILFVIAVTVDPILLPVAAYPIMMASDGVLIPIASLGFLKSG